MTFNNDKGDGKLVTMVRQIDMRILLDEEPVYKVLYLQRQSPSQALGEGRKWAMPTNSIVNRRKFSCEATGGNIGDHPSPILYFTVLLHSAYLSKICLYKRYLFLLPMPLRCVYTMRQN